MLEALISLRRQGESELKKRGDVLCVKPAGAPWGVEETRIHQVVEWEDAELERRLAEQQAAGEPHPVLAYPYAVYEEAPELKNARLEDLRSKDGRPLPQRMTMKTRSRERVDVDRLPGPVKESVLDADVAVPKLAIGRYVRRSQ